LLQGNNPSVIGGGATGNSSPAPFAKDAKQTPDKSIPNAMALTVFFIPEREMGGREGVQLLVGKMGNTKNLPDQFNKKCYFFKLTSSIPKSKYFGVSPRRDKSLQGGLPL
jgi:hypothetical protein